MATTGAAKETKKPIDWTTLWKKDDWMSVWIGFIILIVFLAGFTLKLPDGNGRPSPR